LRPEPGDSCNGTNFTMTPTDDSNKIPAIIQSVYPPLLLMGLAGLLIYWSYDYGETARRLPLLVSSGIFVLIFLDLLSRFPNKIGALIQWTLGAGFQDREMKHDPNWRDEIVQITWVAICLAGMALFGILATIPMFIFMYMRIQGKQKPWFSLLIAAIVVAMVGLIFEFFLEYDLYRGMLLNDDGI
jgi:uncharacterized membrane protein (DUF373 family)